MKNYLTLFIILSSIFSSCIKDDLEEDFVEPTILITTKPDTILINSDYQFEFMYLNSIGLQENVNAVWSSSDTSIIEINNAGLANTKAIGKADIMVEYADGGINLKDKILVNVGLKTVEQSEGKSGTIQTTSSYALQGSFTLKEEGDKLVLAFLEDYKASTALPGLFVYLSNNRNSIANAYEISAVQTFEGAHSYTIENIGINEYQFLLYFCKPFNVKVGDGDIK